MTAKDQEQAIAARIAELKRRWPTHSAPASMWQELEELEERLEELRDHPAGPGGSDATGISERDKPKGASSEAP